MYFFQDPSFPNLCQRALSGPIILFIALLFPNVFFTSWTTRSTTFVAIVTSSAAAFREHSIPSQIVGYLMGFMVIWTIIWSADLLLIRNPHLEFKRIRRVRDNANGTPQYEWEPFPEHLSSQRVWWVLDLICNPRGIGWAHRKRFYSPPKDIWRLYEEQEKATNMVKKVTINGSRSVTNSPVLDSDMAPIGRGGFLMNHMAKFALDWILVEIATHGMTLDSFLNGSEDFNPFMLSRPDFLQWTRLLPYRMTVAAIGCYSIIDLFFVTVSLVGVSLGEVVLGTWGETWMYPRHWGSISDLYYRGIAGFWGTFWHDLFTYGFLTFAYGLVPSNSLPNAVPSKRTRRFLRINLIFALSAFMHMAGSYIQSERTIPVLTFLTFYLQGVGICFQEMLMRVLERMRVKKETSRAIVFVFSVVWGVWTFLLLLQDMAMGKLFRTKFLPFSVTGLWLGNSWPGWY